MHDSKHRPTGNSKKNVWKTALLIGSWLGAFGALAADSADGMVSEGRQQPSGAVEVAQNPNPAPAPPPRPAPPSPPPGPGPGTPRLV